MAVPLLRTLILYCAVICAVRLMGKRQIGELDPSELVVTILVSDLAAVPMQDLGIPLLSGLVPIATLVVLEIFLSFAALKSRRFRRLLNGQPAIIIRRGQLDIGKLRQMRLTTDEVIETLRKQNVAAVSDVKYGVIEPDGTLMRAGDILRTEAEEHTGCLDGLALRHTDQLQLGFAVGVLQISNAAAVRGELRVNLELGERLVKMQRFLEIAHAER